MLGMKHLFASLGLVATLAMGATTAHANNLCAGLPSYSLNPLIGGSPMDLCKLPARALLVVNTASQCGFTKQYGSLEKLHQRYKARGLQVVGIPANDFGGQEPGKADGAHPNRPAVCTSDRHQQRSAELELSQIPDHPRRQGDQLPVQARPPQSALCAGGGGGIDGDEVNCTARAC